MGKYEIILCFEFPALQIRHLKVKKGRDIKEIFTVPYPILYITPVKPNLVENDSRYYHMHTWLKSI